MVWGVVRAAALVIALGAGLPSRAQEPPADGEAHALYTDLIGAPVFAADGTQIGKVTDVAVDQDGQPGKIKMTSDARLGLGSRTLEIPARVFTVLRGAVVVDLPSEAVHALPELSEQENDR
jgi:sporulation protein YlmC with PRC-barrel domain